MSGVTFTDKERSVFYTILKYPGYNDRQISDVTGVNSSTVTAIRRRLQDNGVFRTIRVPALQKLGCEIITVAYGSFNAMADRAAKEKFFEFIAKDNNVIYAVEGGNSAIIIGISKNYSDVKKMIDGHLHFFNEHNLSQNGDWKFLLFPYEVSRMINFFEYHHALKPVLQVEDNDVSDVHVGYEDCTPYNLSKKEKLALYGLVRFPDEPDNFVAEKVGLSRQGLAQIKKRFMGAGLLTERNIPDIQMLGLDILAFSHSRFNPRTPLKQRQFAIKKIISRTPQFLMLSGNFENIMMGLFTDYEHFNRVKMDDLMIYKQHDFLRGDPEMLLIPVQSSSVIKELDFSPILKQHLEIEEILE